MTNEERELILLRDTISILIMIIDEFMKVLPEDVLELPSTKNIKVYVERMRRERGRDQNGETQS